MKREFCFLQEQQRAAGEKLKQHENFTPTVLYFYTKEEEEEVDFGGGLHFMSLVKLSELQKSEWC